MTRSNRRRGVPGRSPASPATVEAHLREELGGATASIQLLEQKLAEATGTFAEADPGGGIADLERQVINDPGWRTFAIIADREFSPEGMTQLRAVCRLMMIANPLIKHGVRLRTAYVHGQGYTLAARATGRSEANDAEQDVQAVVSALVEDPANQRAVFGQQACEELEGAAASDGDVFIALFTRPMSGWVQTRTFTADEVTEIITNPDDASEPWYYRRVWTRQGYDETGQKVFELQERLYPDVDYRPRRKPTSFAGVPISWDAPIVHVAVNRPHGWLRGIPDVYSGINWARAYKEFLEQWAGLMKSLSRFAWKLTVEGKQKEQAKRAMRAAGTARAATGEQLDVGGTAVTPPNGDIEAIPKTGAVIDAESGRPLAMMIAAALGLPVTMLLADPGQTGARATAATLDWPTELIMMSRRALWAGARLRICRYAITESVRAPRGALKGTIKRDPVTDRETLTLAGDTDDTVDIDWPPLDEVEPKDIIDAAVAAAGPGVLPPVVILRELLAAFKIRDPESIIEKMTDDDGQFIWPKSGGALDTGGQAAALGRAGDDPANAGVGRMGPDGQPAGDGPGGPGEVAGVSAEAAARQADAEFGLFGGKITGGDGTEQDGAAQAEPDTEPGATPADVFDPEFFTL